MHELHRAPGLMVLLDDAGAVHLCVESEDQRAEWGGLVLVVRPTPAIVELARVCSGPGEGALAEGLMRVVVAAYPGCDLRSSGPPDTLSVWGPENLKGVVGALARRLLDAVGGP